MFELLIELLEPTFDPRGASWKSEARRVRVLRQLAVNGEHILMISTQRTLMPQDLFNEIAETFCPVII